jgi:hypothetical protein
VATTMIYTEHFEEAFNKHDLDFQACALGLSITCVSKSVNIMNSRFLCFKN